MNQTQYQAQECGRTQCEIILGMLVAAQGNWVSLPDLMSQSGSAAVHSRIADLRNAGNDIAWRSDRVGRKVHSWYRLVQTQEGE